MRNFLYAMASLSIFGCTTPAAADSDTAFTLPSGVGVHIIEAPFENSKFTSDGCTGTDVGCRINGHVPFGTDFDLPKTYVKSISITFQKKTYLLDVSDMYDAWGSRPLEQKGVIRYFGGQCFDENNCQVRGLFSDAAGSFVAEWKIINGVPVRTILTNSNDVVNLFHEHIDPPTFD